MQKTWKAKCTEQESDKLVYAHHLSVTTGRSKMAAPSTIYIENTKFRQLGHIEYKKNTKLETAPIRLVQEKA